MTAFGRARALVRDFPRLVRTARHLTPRQVLWRFWTSGRFHLYKCMPAVAAAGLGRAVRPSLAGVSVVAGWLQRKFPGALSARQLQLASDAAEGRFTFLNRTLDCGSGPVDWRPAGMSRLWQYHLHYGEYVASLALGARQNLGFQWAERAWALVDDWIAGNPPGSRPGWEPYPLSVRVANWATTLGASFPAASTRGFLERLFYSLAAQGRFLARHIEYQLGGNHLIKNAKALLILGTLIDGPEAEQWRRRGRALLMSELGRQVLPDGGHVERSPLYHCQVLEDVLDCLAICAAGGPVALMTEHEIVVLQAAARRMTSWLETMLHPDGGLPLFNDCVVAGELTPQTLLAYAARLSTRGEGQSRRTVALPSSGYYVLQSGQGRMVIDCGPVGPDELPAHAHADTLSFEFTWGTQRVIVDSGTAEYMLDDLRRYVRSTAGHNTVMVDGFDQSEIWASHRVGRRARPLGVRLDSGSDTVSFVGAHDGYAWLGVIHHRHVIALGEAWVIIDELIGYGRHRFESFVHLHPTFGVEKDGNGGWLVTGDGARFRLLPLGAVLSDLAIGWYCPDWGQVSAASVLRLNGEGSLPVAFGYVVGLAGLDAQLTLVADGTGVTLTGWISAGPVSIRSDRAYPLRDAILHA